MIIGITGYARHWKDTCASLIKEMYPEKLIEIKHFADPLKRMACEMFGWSMDYIEKNKETVDTLPCNRQGLPFGYVAIINCRLLPYSFQLYLVSITGILLNI